MQSRRRARAADRRISSIRSRQIAGARTIRHTAVVAASASPEIVQSVPAQTYLGAARLDQRIVEAIAVACLAHGIG